jgi:hypothetical protein
LPRQAFEVFVIVLGAFSPDLMAVSVFRFSHEVHGQVFDDGDVFGTLSGSQAGEAVVEDDVGNPVESAFDAPTGAHGAGDVSASRWAEERSSRRSCSILALRSTAVSTLAMSQSSWPLL